MLFSHCMTDNVLGIREGILKLPYIEFQGNLSDEGTIELASTVIFQTRNFNNGRKGEGKLK